MREWRIREEVEVRDRGLIESFDKRERCTRKWWTREADRRDELMFHKMFHMDSRHNPDKPTSSHPNRPDPPT